MSVSVRARHEGSWQAASLVPWRYEMEMASASEDAQEREAIVSERGGCDFVVWGSPPIDRPDNEHCSDGEKRHR